MITIEASVISFRTEDASQTVFWHNAVVNTRKTGEDHESGVASSATVLINTSTVTQYTGNIFTATNWRH